MCLRRPGLLYLQRSKVNTSAVNQVNVIPEDVFSWWQFDRWQSEPNWWPLPWFSPGWFVERQTERETGSVYNTDYISRKLTDQVEVEAVAHVKIPFPHMSMTAVVTSRSCSCNVLVNATLTPPTEVPHSMWLRLTSASEHGVETPYRLPRYSFCLTINKLSNLNVCKWLKSELGGS